MAFLTRAERRNAVREMGGLGRAKAWTGQPARYVPAVAVVRLNRSRELPRAISYAQAAKIAAINALPKIGE
jgi:hypothetical protein